MSEEELRASMIRELAINVLVSPIVLLIRLPIALLALSLQFAGELLGKVIMALPGFRIDCYQYWRKRP